MIRNLLIISGAGLILAIVGIGGAFAVGGRDLARHDWTWVVTDDNAGDEDRDPADQDGQHRAEHRQGDGQQDQDVDGAQAQDAEDGPGGRGGGLLLSPTLGAGLGLQLAGQTIGIAQGRGDLRLGAAGGGAVGEVAFIVGDDLVRRDGRQTDQAALQAGQKFGAVHCSAPR